MSSVIVVDACSREQGSDRDGTSDIRDGPSRRWGHRPFRTVSSVQGEAEGGGARMIACASCGAAMRQGDSFCSRCGGSVRERLGGPSLQIPLSPALPLLEERRHVTVVFADLTGSTSLAERLDPEDLRRILASFFAAMSRAIQRHGGTVDKYVGDAVMAVFGAPVAHEDDAIRAVTAAIDMQDAIDELNVALERDRGLRLALRIGINTGEVVAGPLAGDVQRTYTVVGDTVNTAQRLQAAAEAGGILVGASTYRAASRGYEFRSVPPVTAKGKAAPLKAYAFVAAAPARPSGAERRRVSAPLVGRDAELGTLLQRIDRLASGRGGVVILTGEAGIGKSRLVAELRRRTSTEAVTWLEGRSLSIGQTISYYPFLEIVRAVAGIGEDEPDREAWAKLEAAVRELIPDEAAEVVPALGVLLALPTAGEMSERVRHLDAEALRRGIFLAARRLVAQLGRRRPLALVFEDWHWADASSVALLEHLLPLVATDPVLVLLAGRREPEAPGERAIAASRRDHADRTTEIELASLTPTATSELVRGLLARDLPAEVERLALERSEGNPFFVEELISALIEVGAVVRDLDGERWQLTERLEDVEIPDTLQGILMARIDRLEQDAKEVLKLAAVIGRTFFYRVLRVVAHAADELDQDLAELVGRDFIRVKDVVPELEYVFKHALAQEVTYDSILLERRRQLHRHVGETIESLFADRLTDFYGILAYHFARAEDWPKAQEYLFKAGDHAGRIAADAEALVHYREAAAAYARAFGDRWDPLARASLDRKLGEALFRQGEYQRALEHLRDALATLGRPYPSTRWGVRRAIARELLRQAAHRLVPWLALRRAGLDEVQAREVWRLYQTLGWIDYAQDVERVLLDGLTALNFAERTGLRGESAQGLTGIGIICDAVGLFRLASGYHRAALSLAEEAADPLGLGLAQLGLALHGDHLGTWNDAIAHAERSAEVFRQAGDLRGWGTATGLVGRLAHLQGDFARSMRAIREVARAGEDGADRQLQGVGFYGQGANLLRVGELDAAVTLLERAVAVFRGIPDHRLAAGASEYLGQAHLRRGDLAKALAVFREAERSVAERQLRGVVWTRTGIAEAHLVLAERTAGEERARALRDARELCRAALRQGRHVREGLAAAWRLEGTRLWLEGRAADARRAWERSLRAAREVGARYDHGMTLLEMGQRLRSEEHLDQAGRELSALGAHFDAEQARLARGHGGQGQTTGTTTFW